MDGSLDDLQHGPFLDLGRGRVQDGPHGRAVRPLLPDHLTQVALWQLSTR